MLYSKNSKCCTVPVGTVFHFCFLFLLNIVNMINEPDKKKSEWWAFFSYLLRMWMQKVLYKNIPLFPSFHPREEMYISLSKLHILPGIRFIPWKFSIQKTMCFCANHITNLNFNSTYIVTFPCLLQYTNTRMTFRDSYFFWNSSLIHWEKLCPFVRYFQMILHDFHYLSL